MFRLIIWLLLGIIRWCYSKYKLGVYRGIHICDFASSSEEQGQLFLTRIVKALELVRTHGTRRFYRLQKHLRYVVNLRMLRWGSYDRHLHGCNIDYARLRCAEDEAWEVLLLASTLIHEATHGLIYSRGIAYDKKHRLRIERLCHQEEVRFVRRLSPEVNWGSFDEDGYVAEFQTTRWRLVFNQIKHLWEPKKHSA